MNIFKKATKPQQIVVKVEKTDKMSEKSTPTDGKRAAGCRPYPPPLRGPPDTGARVRATGIEREK